MQERIALTIYQLLYEIASLDSKYIFLVMLLVIAVIVLDGVTSTASKKARQAGFDARANPVSIDGSKNLPLRNYVSEMQGLAGKPDALIVEDGFIIPIERKPLARKLHDRYIAQLLVYMRLIEEFEGKKPPYGYLILGSNCRRFKIENSEERQAWLQKILDEMQGILNGNQAVPTPHPRKCARCHVKDSCSHKIIQEGGNNKPKLSSKSPSLSKSVH
jgi:CRISPR/Cas system-associated exonuclease Cas4 (RecB family)